MDNRKRQGVFTVANSHPEMPGCLNELGENDPWSKL